MSVPQIPPVVLLRIELEDMPPKQVKSRAWSALQVRQVLAEMERPHFDLAGREPRVPPPGFRKLRAIPFSPITRLKY